MVAKSKVKRKPNPFLKKENKKARNVKQIVRIYLDERKKAKNSKPRASKQIERAPFQNPLNDMFPLQQPYNPHFYPRNPIQQPMPATTQQLPMVHKML